MEDEKKLHLYNRFTMEYFAQTSSMLYRAKSVLPAMAGQWVYGYYFRRDRAPQCITEMKDTVRDFFNAETGSGAAEHFIINSGMSDWNLPAPMNATPIDFNTLCRCIGVPETPIDRTLDGLEYLQQLRRSKLIYEYDVVDVVYDSGSTWEVFIAPNKKEYMLGGSSVDKRRIIGNVFDDKELCDRYVTHNRDIQDVLTYRQNIAEFNCDDVKLDKQTRAETAKEF